MSKKKRCAGMAHRSDRPGVPIRIGFPPYRYFPSRITKAIGGTIEDVLGREEKDPAKRKEFPRQLADIIADYAYHYTVRDTPLGEMGAYIMGPVARDDETRSMYVAADSDTWGRPVPTAFFKQFGPEEDPRVMQKKTGVPPSLEMDKARSRQRRKYEDHRARAAAEEAASEQTRVRKRRADEELKRADARSRHEDEVVRTLLRIQSGERGLRSQARYDQLLGKDEMDGEGRRKKRRQKGGKRKKVIMKV